jgi:hypothetical protein
MSRTSVIRFVILLNFITFKGSYANLFSEICALLGYSAAKGADLISIAAEACSHERIFRLAYSCASSCKTPLSARNICVKSAINELANVFDGTDLSNISTRTKP